MNHDTYVRNAKHVFSSHYKNLVLLYTSIQACIFGTQITYEFHLWRIVKVKETACAAPIRLTCSTVIQATQFIMQQCQVCFFNSLGKYNMSVVLNLGVYRFIPTIKEAMQTTDMYEAGLIYVTPTKETYELLKW